MAKSAKAEPGAPGPVIAEPVPPSATALPFTYMGKLMSGQDVTVILSQGESNRVVDEGDTIAVLYRFEHIAQGAIALVSVPFAQRPTIVIGEPQ